MGRSGPTIAACVFVLMSFGIYAMYARWEPTSVVVKATPNAVPEMPGKAVIPKTLAAVSSSAKTNIPAKGPAANPVRVGSNKYWAAAPQVTMGAGNKLKWASTAPRGGKTGTAPRAGEAPQLPGGDGKSNVAPTGDKTPWLPGVSLEKIKELSRKYGIATVQERYLSKMSEAHRKTILEYLNSDNAQSIDSSGPTLQGKKGETKSVESQKYGSSHNGLKKNLGAGKEGNSASESASESSDYSSSSSDIPPSSVSYESSSSEESGSSDYSDSASSSAKPSSSQSASKRKSKKNDRASAKGPSKAARQQDQRSKSNRQPWSNNKRLKSKSWANERENADGNRGGKNRNREKNAKDAVMQTTWRVGRTGK